MIIFTYYCEDHPGKVVQAGPPSDPHNVPTCPMCYTRMLWVPNGGTEVPK